MSLGATASHTPGPWIVRGPGQSVICENNEQGTFVALAHQAQMGRARANARLIAAAPEMLAALKEILSALNHLEEYGPGSTDLSGFLVGIPRLITKAEGK
jgi:hypothetical protein